MFNIDLLSLLLGKQGDKKQYEHGQFFMFKKNEFSRYVGDRLHSMTSHDARGLMLMHT